MTSHISTPFIFRPAALLLLGATALLGTLCAAQPQSAGAAQRGTVCYTAWDDYFFYAAFQVDDPRVNSVNNTPLSQPQQDDDIEVFFDTKGPKASASRLPGTYQMAVSAGNGAYFSVGSAAGTPQPKLVFTYKYAATVDGTLNSNSDTDLGYTVEMAIPWHELGLSGPPATGTVWGFNVINRDRQTASAPANHLASLSPAVDSAATVQNPQDWTQITFVDSLASAQSTAQGVFCPLVQGHYPTVDGTVRSGEYFRPDGFSVGAPTIAAAAPTAAEEPNVNISANDEFAEALAETPQPTVVAPGQAATVTSPDQTADVPPAQPVQPAPAPKPQKPSVPDYDIQLPGGGTVHIGKLQPPPAPVIPPTTDTASAPVPQIPRGKHGGKSGGGSSSGGELAQLPSGYGSQFPTVGPDLDTSQTLRLLDQTRVAPLFIARYQAAVTAQSLFGAVDQPVAGGGSWFGGGSVQYDIDQLKDARRAGVDVLLVDYDTANPNASGSLLTLVQALQEMRSANQDYPLLAVHIVPHDDDSAASPALYSEIYDFFRRVPPEYRAEAILSDAQDNAPEYIAIVNEDVASGIDLAALRTQFQQDFSAEGAGLFVGSLSDGKIVGIQGDTDVSSSLVTPVSGDAPAYARDQGASYNASWGAADSAGADWALLNSWNNYAGGTEAAATRQYGEQYADLTKLYSLQWNGGQPWRARYLKATVPSVMSPNALYTVQVRVENAGTLPWRVGDAYALGYRWYKDGRLYDDSAPHLPINTNIYPGQSTTLTVAILPHNQYGNAIEPGDYTLVFDMVQGDDRWFNLAGDIGLKVHVHIAAATDALAPRVTFLSSTLPTRIAAGMPYTAVVTLRNDGTDTLKANDAQLGFTATRFDGTDGASQAQAVTGKAVLADDIGPGAVGSVTVPVKIGSGAGSSGSVYQLKWSLASPEVAGHLIQVVQTVADDDGASFVLSDIPRNLKTSEVDTAQLGILNRGPVGWTGDQWQVGYTWTYLDGTNVPDSDAGAPIYTPLLTAKDPLIAPNVATAVIAKFHTPTTPGRYYLVWNVRDPQGNFSSELGQKMHPGADLPAMVTVTESPNADARTVDISKYYNVTGYGFEGSEGGDIDGNGNAIPGDQMPPDGAGDMVSNPVLVGKSGPADYPSGFYAPGHAADHRIAYYFPDTSKTGVNTVSCQGQRIDLPSGYTSVHLLAAATSDAAASATFTLGGSASSTQQLTIASWTQAPTSPNSATALSFPYRLHQGTVDASFPCVLGDYEIDLPAGTRSITLPTNTDVKLFAITVAR